MGPRASNSILDAVYRSRANFHEQKMPDILHICIPSIPDRGSSDGVSQGLLEAVRLAEEANAQSIIFACFSAYMHAKEAKSESSKIIDALKHSIDAVKEGNMDSTILCRGHLAKFLSREGLRHLLPENHIQEEVDRLILSFKSYSDTVEQSSSLISRLTAEGVRRVILMCTELSALYWHVDSEYLGLNFENPMRHEINSALTRATA